MFHAREDAWGPAGAHQVIGCALEGLGRQAEAAAAYRHAIELFTAVADAAAERTAPALRAMEEGAGSYPAAPFL
ncbi:hypothetical protein SVTN_00465 [Streptomyces vietnamensis]|uniref:Tetratricopeptide repeat protein n=1 Tax=Streptomyces vietnamensis TaxID=362257 RepID=A0A0B5I4Q3_9ACTN|nr:hypothetical protein SVTN_00465 [Streptomyces vietnamensis]